MKLRSKISNLSLYLQSMIKIFKNISLLSRNSFHVDVTARELIEFDSAEDLQELFSTQAPKRWMVLSGGNNILFTRAVEQTLLHPRGQSIEIVAEDHTDKSVTLKVAAGVEWDDVVEWCVERGLWGAENLSLIPGKAGAAPIQNIGAYGSELCDILVKVDYFDTELCKPCSIEATACEFGYRESIFKGQGQLRGRAIVTAIYLRLSREANPQLHYADLIDRVAMRSGAAQESEPSLRTIREVICEVRREKLPDTSVMGNAGSFFKNPIVERVVAERLLERYPTMPHYSVLGDDTKVKLAAGWLIDQAGMKGYTQGRVGVHARQALVLVNLGGATGGEVLELAREVQQAVRDRFSVEIDMEVNIV